VQTIQRICFAGTIYRTYVHLLMLFRFLFNTSYQPSLHHTEQLFKWIHSTVGDAAKTAIEWRQMGAGASPLNFDALF